MRQPYRRKERRREREKTKEISIVHLNTRLIRYDVLV